MSQWIYAPQLPGIFLPFLGPTPHYDPPCIISGFGVDGVDPGRNLRLPHLPVNHDQNLRVGVEGVFSGPYIHHNSPCIISGFGVDGVDPGRNLRLPHLPVNHDQNLRVGVEGVFSGPYIHHK